MQKINIPKVDPKKVYKLIIQRGGLVESKNALRVRLQRQTVAGLLIPEGFEMWAPGQALSSINGQSSHSPTVMVEGWKVNEVLRTIFIDELRKHAK